MIVKDELIESGKMFKAHGYKGEINADIFFDLTPDEVSSLTCVADIDGIFVPFFLESVRAKGEGLLLKFRGINSDSEVKTLVNKELFFLRRQLEDYIDLDEIEEDSEFLIGYAVFDNTSGDSVGNIADIEEGVEYDYLVVENEKNGKEIRIPFVEDLIGEIDHENRVLKMDIPEGLLELE